MPRAEYKYECDGVIGPKGRDPCSHGNEDGPVDQEPHPSSASAVNAGMMQGYKRPHDADDVLPGHTTHMCCPQCYAEYLRWNDVFPIPMEI